MKKSKKAGLAVIALLIICMTGCSLHMPFGSRGTAEEKLSSIKMLIDQYYLEDTSGTEFEEGLYKGYVEQLGDPYSVYYTKEEYDDMMEDDSGHYKGIGVVLSQNIKTKEAMIVRVFEGGPADKAGIRRYDVLAGVDGVSTSNMELSDIVDMIRGSEEKSVKLTIYRDGKKKEIVSERGEVESQMVEAHMVNDEIGYIAIYEFIENTYDQFHESYEKLTDQGMKKLILDVRSNPGGFLDQVQKISDDLIPKGEVIVSTEDNRGKKEYLKAETDQKLEIPMVLLVDGFSASASEILAGVVKDYGLGTIMGEKTYGKGIVQRIFPLGDGSAVKLTISKYFTPNGNYIHEKGIEPDIVLKEKYVEKKGDTLLDDTWIRAAVKELNKK